MWIIFARGQRPKGLVITWVVAVFLVLETLLIYFWVKSGRRPRTSPGLVYLHKSVHFQNAISARSLQDIFNSNLFIKSQAVFNAALAFG